MTAYVRRVGAADVAGEDVAAVHAGADRQADVRGDDLPQRAHHPFLVLPGARRRAAGEVELDGADVDVRLEPRQPVRLAGAADRGGQRVDPVEQGGRAVGPDQLVGSGDLHEGDRHLAVLGLAARDGEVRAERRGHVLVEVSAGARNRRRRDRARSRLESVASGALRPVPRRATRHRPRQRSRRSARSLRPTRGPRARTRVSRRGLRRAAPGAASR